VLCSWESPFGNCLSGAPGGDYLSRGIVDCRGAPTDTAFMGLTSCRRITIAKTLARRRRECAIGHHADCRVAAERYTLICDGPVISSLRGRGGRSRRALAMHKIRPCRCLRGRGRDCQIARRTHDNRAPKFSRRSGRHAVPGSAVSVLRSWHAFPPLAFLASLHRRAVGLAGDTSSEFLHPRFRGQGVLSEPGRFTDPAVTSA
jgi:hypothetical protein